MTDDEKQIISRINTLIGAGRSVWFGLMSFLAFIAVTLMSIRDADLFLAERQTTLPIIGVEIPTLMFFAFAPMLAATFSAYVHVNLARLFTAVSDAPAMVEEKPLSDFLNPWLVADLAMHHRADGALRERPLTRLSMLVVRALTFWLTPLLLFAFYWRSFAAHNEVLTLLGCVLPLVLSILAARESAKHLDRSLAPNLRQHPFHDLRGRYAVMTVALAVFGWLRTEGDMRVYTEILSRNSAIAGRILSTGNTWARFDVLSEFHDSTLGYAADDPPVELQSPGLNVLVYQTRLAETDFVDIPKDWPEYYEAYSEYLDGWCVDRALDRDICNILQRPSGMPDTDRRRQWCARNGDRLRVDAARLIGSSVDELSHEDVCDTYYDYLPSSFVGGWYATRFKLRAGLTTRDLTGQDLRNADLAYARLEGANLYAARGRDANFYYTGLEGAVLSDARLERAFLHGASLQHARLTNTWLDYANLTEAQLHGAMLDGTVLRGAILDRAVFGSATLNGTWLQGALIDGAYFSKTTYFAPASMRGAGLRNLDLSMLVFDPAILNETFADASVILPEGMPRPAHWSDAQLSVPDFHVELSAYRESIGQHPGLPLLPELPG